MKSSSLLEKEIQAYENMLPRLLKFYPGKHVVIVGDSLTGHYDNFAYAAAFAVSHYGRGPYLIRQVGAPAPQLPLRFQVGVFKAQGGCGHVP